MADVFYFSTSWCQPCKAFKPAVQQAILETGKHVTFLDAEVNADLAQRYDIRSVPTIVVVDQGNVLYRHTGIMSKQQVASLLNTF